MKQFLILFLLPFIGKTYCQDIVIPDSIIIWHKDYKLTFQDFRNPIPPLLGFNAVSSISVEIEIEEIDTLIVDVHVKCVFYRNSSFFKKMSKGSFISLDDSLLLNHEQGHFDLAEIYSRKIKQKISYFIKNKITKSEIIAFYNTTLDALHKEGIIYDKETDFSRNKLEQSRWNKNLLKRLSQTSPN